MKFSAGIVLLAMAVASPEIRYFHFLRPVVNQMSQPGQTCFVLDTDIFANATPQLADLRLYHEGMETPYAIHTAVPQIVTEKSIEPLNLGKRDGLTIFDAAMPDVRYRDIELALSAQNFIATVTISGSQVKTDGATTRIGSFTIFDLTRQKLGRSTILHLQESDFPYLHFQIFGPISPDEVTGLSIEPLPSSQPGYQPVAESSQATQKDRSTVIDFTVPAHIPVDRLVLIPGPEPFNFSRDVSITVTPITQPATADASESLHPATFSGNFLRVHSRQGRHQIDEERLAIDVETMDLGVPVKWTVAIHNGDDSPLVPKSVQLQMLERQLCFDASNQAKYSLYYGDPALASPHYDYATLFVLQPDATRASLGPAQQNPSFQSRPDERPFTERHPALLWVVLLLVIAILGAVALQSAKRTAH